MRDLRSHVLDSILTVNEATDQSCNIARSTESSAAANVGGLRAGARGWLESWNARGERPFGAFVDGDVEVG